jgi:hypothetical protein
MTGPVDESQFRESRYAPKRAGTRMFASFGKNLMIFERAMCVPLPAHARWPKPTGPGKIRNAAASPIRSQVLAAQPDRRRTAPTNRADDEAL